MRLSLSETRPFRERKYLFADLADFRNRIFMSDGMNQGFHLSGTNTGVSSWAENERKTLKFERKAVLIRIVTYGTVGSIRQFSAVASNCQAFNLQCQALIKEAENLLPAIASLHSCQFRMQSAILVERTAAGSGRQDAETIPFGKNRCLSTRFQTGLSFLAGIQTPIWRFPDRFSGLEQRSEKS
jgi:hypothetical protein